MKKIGYLIAAHADPQQLNRLVNAIDYNSDIYIHIDAKSDIQQFKQAVTSKSVVFLENRVIVSWAGISQVDATLRLIKVALNSGNDYSHLVLLSGTDYPIKKLEYINGFFNQNSGREIIRFIDMRESPQHYMKQLKFKWFKEPFYRGSYKAMVLLDKVIRRFANSLRLQNSWDETLVPYYGSNWWALTPECCKFILEYINDNRTYYEINKFSFAPDEHFFHTLVGNSVYALKSDGLQAYEGRGTSKLANFHIIHPSLAKWYDLADWDEVTASDKLFVRKVNSSKSKELLDRIDRELLN